MPSITVFTTDLFELLGRPLEEGEMRSAMLGCKAEVEGLEGNELKLEIKDSNRIDLLSAEGVARTLRGYLGLDLGLPHYPVDPSGIRIDVSPAVKDVRPYVVAFTARGAQLSEEILVSYMNFQEKIHTTYGRGRKRMAIGFYDLDLIVPPVKYVLTKPDENAFAPLGLEEEMTPRRILDEHPKGREFSHLLEGFDAYPMIHDSEGQVLSMPPIINSNSLGRVTTDTRNLFVEATGLDYEVLSLGLNVLATALADRGAKLGSVELHYGKKGIRMTPNLSTKVAHLDPATCNRVLGLDLGADDIADLLRRSRFDARPSSGGIEVTIPPYRGDIMHQTDLIEEVTIAYGYDRMDPIVPEIPTVGRTDPLEDFSDSLRELMVGLGFQEILTFVLTSPENVVDRLMDRRVAYVEIENPCTQTFSIFRPDLLPSVLEFLGHNAHVAYPQKVFESGDAVELHGDACRTVRKLCYAWADSRVNLTQMKAVLLATLGSIGADCTLEETKEPPFIEGRCAEILLGGQRAGIFGEIHPLALDAWQIPVPVQAVELDVDVLFTKLRRG